MLHYPDVGRIESLLGLSKARLSVSGGIFIFDLVGEVRI